MAKLERRLDTYFLYMAAMYQNGESIYSKNSDHLDDAAKDEYMQLVADSWRRIKIGLGLKKDQDTPNPFDNIEAVLADDFVPAKPFWI